MFSFGAQRISKSGRKVNYNHFELSCWRGKWQTRGQRTMSIVTKTGDDGSTGLMYNRRLPKCHPRVEAYGAVDELNATLGLARASARHPFVSERVAEMQSALVVLMGELAVQPEDLARYVRDGFALVSPEMTAKLDRVVKEIEGQMETRKGWAAPGANVSSAALDMARTVCRRAERRVCALREIEPSQNSEIVVFLNRMSDALWLLARWEEGEKG
jgi:cob(I)alamin adenosyltransferase